MASNPVMILLMKYSFVDSILFILLSLIWLVVLELFAFLLFKHASKKITVHGG